jgi:hypothetical protein
MVWIKKREESWLPTAHGAKRGEKSAERQPEKKLYTVDEVARIFKVTKKTVYKWMSYEDDPNEAIIPPEAWYKMRTGRILIDEWIVLKLLNPNK